MPTKVYRKFLFISLAFLLYACGGAPENSGIRVVGGSAPDLAALTSQATVALEDVAGKKTFCSGTLIHEQLILTSAHCLQGKKESEIRVRMLRGETFLVESVQSYKAEQKFGVNFDIAWLKLTEPARSYQPIEILQNVESAKTAEASRVFGYGQLKSQCEDGDESCQTGRLFESAVTVKESLNKGRWFHLLLIEAKKGTGPCLGDSGGPLFVTIHGQTFLAGNFVGWDKRLVIEERETICDNGEAIYNFSGAYRAWIENTSGFALPLDETKNPKAAPANDPVTIRDPVNFAEWCKSRDETDSTWYTVQRLVSLAGDYAWEHGGDIRRVFEDCAYAEINLRNKIRLDKGLILDAYAPDSFGDKAKITDLRPLKSLETFDIETLTLIGHAIEDFTMIGALPKLKRLEITENNATVRGSLDVSGPFHLERLRVKNSDKAVQLETISKSENLRYLELENVRTEGEAVILPAPKLLELTVKADVNLELPEAMPSLQTLEIVGARSLVMATSLPKLRTFQVENSQQALKAGEELHFDEMPQIESFLFRKNKGILSIALPRAPKLRTLEIVASGVRSIGEIDGMIKLTKADFSKNQLSLVPAFINVPMLETLSLSDNPIADVSSLNGWDSLRILNLEHMNGGGLSTLGGLKKLPNLQTLRLKNNSFRSVKEFLRFPKLEVLVLTENDIQDIANLSALKDLSYLEIVDNPLATKKCPLADARYCRFEWTTQN